MPRKHIVVSGAVQGVGFRYFTLRTAEQLGLAGWVRNRPNGDVEIEAEGGIDALEKLIEAVGKGPDWSRVKNVKVEDIPETGVTDGTFGVRY